MNRNNADIAWIALSLTPRLGGKTLSALCARFEDDPLAVLKATEAELRDVPGIGLKTARAIAQIDLEAMAAQVERWQRKGVTILPFTSPAYPVSLRHLNDAPATLFVLGDLSGLIHRPAYALVGTRGPTSESRRVAENLAAELAQRGYTVVSGLARGIDTAAHIGALSIPTGQTIAVLGNGVLGNGSLTVYPPENQALAQAILERGGALLCEVSPDAPVSTPGLVARNRIITGLCAGVIVIESTAKGGAMHAARFAQIQGIPLYAIDSPADGNRSLMESGAAPVSPDLQDLPFPSLPSG